LKYRLLIGFVAIIAVAVVVHTFKYPDSMISPGALISAHQELTTDCFACHVPFLGVSSNRCISCHAVDHIGLRSTLGEIITEPKTEIAFHQELIEQDCIACHIDHSGARLAHNPHTFSHMLLLPERRDQCGDCHTKPENEIHLNLTVGCAECHSVSGWKPVMFDHDLFFELDRDHNTTCVTCHVNNVLTEFTCYGCHEHTRANIRRRHEREGIRNFDNCVECHRNAHDEPDYDD